MIRYTIIVPVYNVENYIAQCLNSIINQTYTEFECVIVNDGSTDHSVEIAKKIIQDDSRFRIINQKNQGLSAARNTGIRNSTGEYIIFIDSDDFIDNDALQRINNILLSQQFQVIVFSTYIYYADDNIVERHFGDRSNIYTGTDFLNLCNYSKDYILAACDFVVSRDFLERGRVFFPEGLLHEDDLWIPELLIDCDRLYYSYSGFYYYRCNREGSITSSHNIKRLIDKAKIVSMLQEKIKFYPADKKNAVNFRCAKILFGVITAANLYRQEDRYKDLAREVRGSISVLKCAGKKYRIIFYTYRLLGLRLTSFLLNVMVRMLNKW